MNALCKYTLKVWQTAVFISPVITWLYDLFRSPDIWQRLNNTNISDMLLAFVLMIMVGAFLSVPSALLLWLATCLLQNYTPLNAVHQKKLLCLIGIVLTMLPFFLLDYGGTLNGGDGYICMTYTAVIGISIWGYELPEGNNHTTQTLVEN